MKKIGVSTLSIFLTLFIILGLLASCSSKGGGEGSQTELGSTESASQNESSSNSDDEAEGNTVERDTNEATEGTSSESTPDSGTETEGNTVELEGEHSSLISHAYLLKNNVSAYFPGNGRDSFIYENMNMTLDYALDSSMPQQVTSLKNKAGNVYVENTMDVFIEMADGSRYFAKNSHADGVPNIYRLGYYYYEMRVEGQTFMQNMNGVDSTDINHLSISSKNEIKGAKKTDGVLCVINEEGASDPYVVFSTSLDIDASVYTMLEITMKADANTSAAANVFYIAGEQTEFSAQQRVTVNITCDGNYHTYLVPLYEGADYNGKLTGLRFDVDGNGAKYEISGIRVLGVETDNAPHSLRLCRSWGVYSDKMHQVVQIAAISKTTGIASIGIQTNINADTVAKLVIKDKCDTLHTSLDGVDWATVEYVGFDIIDAGIFGYILPFDGKGGGIKVELADGVYTVEQTMCPEDGTIIPSRTEYNSEMDYYDWVPGGNVNDFYMGSRVYTDDSHDFTKFLEEAYCERNPIDAKNFKIYEKSSTGASYIGYDTLRGIYRLDLAGTGFNSAYYTEPGKHYRINFVVRGDEHDRNIYVMTYSSSGQLECAALLDSGDVMIPVPLEVGKNFSEQYGERGLYNLDDATYSEVIFPLVIDAKEKYEYTVLNLYQNWGNYPLKQLSWIQFFSPYYHLSTGVSETNCILPWMFTDSTRYDTLPDHRAMSAPLWEDQPQHTSAGAHDWLRYIDADGNEVRWENVWNTIDSYGPTYADVKMDYITTDGKMKVSYTHTEMPQTDENRTYYEMTYEVLEDITINNFVSDFQFYKVIPNDPGLYQKVGYLNEENKCVYTDANLTKDPVKYVLGDNCPYFSFFDMDNCVRDTGYANLAFLVYNSEFIIGGEKAEPNFAIVNYEDTVYITLNIEEKTTLKAGDRFVINAILLPWGSQLLEDGIIDEDANNFEYSMKLPDGSLYMDKNVRDVRENTILNPLKAIAGEDAEVIESVFVPKLKTTDGVSAEFTLMGGYNNVAVRIYGFDKMTVPVIYEKIGDHWEKYEVSSINAEKDAHAYDGYCVYYDGDGTYSYSFVTDMDGKNDRTFKIVVDGNYDKWTKENVDTSSPDLLKVYVDPNEMAQTVSGAVNFFESATVSDDGSFVTIKPNTSSEIGESYVIVYQAPSETAESGQYLVFKYRVPSNNKEQLNPMEIYISTINKAPMSDDSLSFVPIQDGEWHVVVLDISKFAHPSFTESDGKYYCQYMRFDFFNKKFTESVELDIAYIGMDSRLEEICKLNQSEFDVLPLIAGTVSGEINTTTYEIDFDVAIDPDADVVLSTRPFGSALDLANGVDQLFNVGSREGGPKDAMPITVGDDMTIAMAGWCIVGGGVSKYVWSADGGHTWQDCGNQNSLTEMPESVIDVAKWLSTSTGYENVEASLKNSSFQGGGLKIDLSAYAGQTVDVVVAAVPTEEPDSYCLLYRFKDIAIPAK